MYDTYPMPDDVWGHIDIALLRERRDWITIPANDSGFKVQLGAGRKYLAGWDNLDYPEWNAEDPGRRGRIPYDDGTVGELASYFTLDHLSPVAVRRTLREAQRVLMIGGVFSIVVPHYSSQLANECIEHKTRFAIDSWRNIFSERQYDHIGEDQGAPWALEDGANFMFGLTERNLVLVTQLIRVETIGVDL